jgi:hypothetical protein
VGRTLQKPKRYFEIGFSKTRNVPEDTAPLRMEIKVTRPRDGDIEVNFEIMKFFVCHQRKRAK